MDTFSKYENRRAANRRLAAARADAKLSIASRRVAVYRLLVVLAFSRDLATARIAMIGPESENFMLSHA